ncbi:MAG: hypothetical protein BWY15_00780 [Firmicutes bacterium ADurb.Bin193]|nr:MAG: hypothetical protein BWY15_00780 [Firmicutes bacterium ADurb.Bin193]
MKEGFFKKISQRFTAFPKRIMDTFLRFPLSILCAVALFAVSDLEEHFDLFSNTIFQRLAVVLGIGIVLFAAGELLLESLGAKRLKFRIITGAVIYVVLQGYYFVFQGFEGSRDGAQFAMIAGAVILIGLFALNTKTHSDFEKNAARIITRVASSGFFAGVLLLGLVAVVGAIDLLLTEMDEKWFIEMVQICFILFMPTMLLMGLPERDDGVSYPKPVSALLTYVILPVIMIFTVVLYAYYIKLAVTRSFPIGELGGVSLAFLGACIPTLILITPFENRFSRVLRNVIPYVLIPVIALLFFTAIRQIVLFGVTPPRYLVIVGGFVALVSTALIKIRGGRFQRIALVITAAALIISAYGPQSAYEMTEASQNMRFERLLVKNDMLKDGKVVPSSNISSDDKEEIKELVRYCDRNDLEMKEYVPKDNTARKEAFGFDIDSYKSRTKYFYTNERAVKVSGYDYIIEDLYNSVSIPELDLNIPKMTKDENIIIKIGNETVCDISRQEIGREILKKIDTENEKQSAESMTYDYENERIKIRLAFGNISLDTDNRENPYEYGDFTLLLKVK